MSVFRQAVAGLRMLLVMTVVLGIGYPAVVTLAAQTFPTQAHGSQLVAADGRVVGSTLLGQSFAGPQWFQPRPSASDYSGQTSGVVPGAQPLPLQVVHCSMRSTVSSFSQPKAASVKLRDTLTRMLSPR